MHAKKEVLSLQMMKRIFYMKTGHNYINNNNKKKNQPVLCSPSAMLSFPLSFHACPFALLRLWRTSPHLTFPDDLYRRSLPLRCIFKIFPSLCLAVASPFFGRFPVRRQNNYLHFFQQFAFLALSF